MHVGLNGCPVFPGVTPSPQSRNRKGDTVEVVAIRTSSGSRE